MDCLRTKFKVIEHRKFNRCTGKTQEGSNSIHAFLIPSVSCLSKFLTAFGELLFLYPCLPPCDKVPDIPELGSVKTVLTKWSWLCLACIQLGSERQLQCFHISPLAIAVFNEKAPTRALRIAGITWYFMFRVAAETWSLSALSPLLRTFPYSLFKNVHRASNI